MAVFRVSALLLLAVAAAVVPHCLASQLGSSVYTWSNTKAIGQGTAGQVHYQTTPASAIVAAVISQASKDSHTTVVLLGCQGKGPVVTEAASLVDLVNKAASSAVYVNAEQAKSAAALQAALEKSLESSSVEYETIGCGGGDHKLADATKSTLLVCSSCSDELEQLQQLQEHLEGREYTLVYAPAADAATVSAAISATRKRKLHGSAAPADFSCDATCQTQVKWLQGVLAAMLMVMALFSGLGCLYFLETPTKFETPKEN